jgi:hypothetical protein
MRHIFKIGTQVSYISILTNNVYIGKIVEQTSASDIRHRVLVTIQKKYIGPDSYTIIAIHSYYNIHGEFLELNNETYF